jgi:hypothetical protein
MPPRLLFDAHSRDLAETNDTTIGHLFIGLTHFTIKEIGVLQIPDRTVFVPIDHYVLKR